MKHYVLDSYALERIKWMKEKLKANGNISIKNDENVIEFALRFLEKNYGW